MDLIVWGNIRPTQTFFELVSFFTDSYSKFTVDFKSNWYLLPNVEHSEKIDQIQNSRSELWDQEGQKIISS